MKKLMASMLAALLVLLCACEASTPTITDHPPATAGNAETGQAEENVPASEPESTPEPSALSVGEEVALNNWLITVTSFDVVSEIAGDYGYFSPDEGNQFGVVSLSVTNNGKEADTFLPSFAFGSDVRAKILYDTDYEYTSTSLLAHSSDMHDSSMNPLTSQSGIIAFQLPDVVVDGDGSLVLVFSAELESVEFVLR